MKTFLLLTNILGVPQKFKKLNSMPPRVKKIGNQSSSIMPQKVLPWIQLISVLFEKLLTSCDVINALLYCITLYIANFYLNVSLHELFYLFG